jgi:hypothetical protein
MAKKKGARSKSKVAKSTPKEGGIGRPKLVYTYGLDDIAAVCGQTKNAINKAIHRGILVPDDLLSIACYIAAHSHQDCRMQVVNALIRQNDYRYPGRPPAVKD